MDRLFNMDNKFFTVMGRVADLIMLNVVFLICCLPIVTIGASLTALHYVTLKMARNEESYIIRSFFKSFKQNFKQATVINLIMLAVPVSAVHPAEDGYLLFSDRPSYLREDFSVQDSADMSTSHIHRRNCRRKHLYMDSGL